jgi:hypothetical protein
MKISFPTQNEIYKAYKAGEEAIQELFAAVRDQFAQLSLQVQQLNEFSSKVARSGE